MSYPKKINATFKAENELQEFRLIKNIESLKGQSIVVFPEVEHLRENTTFRKLVSAKKKAGLELDRFINNNR